MVVRTGFRKGVIVAHAWRLRRLRTVPGGVAVLEALKRRWPARKRLFADGAHDRRALMGKAATLDFVVEAVRRHENQVGFAVLPRRL